MKIFNIENGKEKVYVQLNDMMMLNNSDEVIPASIYEKVFLPGTLVVNDSNRMEFIEFSKPEEVEYFKTLDWIVDYKELRKLSKDEMQTKYEEESAILDQIASEYNETPPENKKIRHSTLKRFDLQRYKLAYYSEIYAIKYQEEEVAFPVVPDSDGFSFTGDDNSYPYEIRASLDPNKLLFMKTNGEKFSRDESIPYNFYNSGIAVAIMEIKSDDDDNSATMDISNSLSEDEKYIIIEFRKQKEAEKPTDDQCVKVSQEKNNDESKFKKMLKKVFKRNKSDK